MSDSNSIEILAAVSTALAALFAAFSAWTSKLSAKAAKDAVEESRLARRAELAPKLILEKDFLDFQFIWPHPDSLNGEAVFFARKHWKDKSPSLPTLSLQNFGQSPALEVTIIFDLEDPNGEFQVPKGYEELGLSVMEMPAVPDKSPIISLCYAKPNGNRYCVGLYHKVTIDIPNCSPNQKRVVEFPDAILHTLFLRGLQYWEKFQRGESSHDIILTAHIDCYAVDGVNYKTQFRWRINPFHHGLINPVIVNGHCFELPMYPKPDGPRVA
jgi:hypothetical protein